MDPSATIMVGVITGAIGSGYFIYGKKQERPVAMIAGAALCIYPYFFDNIWLLCLVGLALIAAPFLIDR